MEYKIVGFDAYVVNDERQVLKTTQTAKGQKVTLVAATRPREDCNYEYVRLSREENGKVQRYSFPLDELYASAKLGLAPGTPESRAQMKKYRYERGLMGRVSTAVGDHLKEQEIVNMLHADLVRQMKLYGFMVDTDNMLVFSVAQMLFDYLRVCSESAGTPLYYKVVTKNGETLQEHPIWGTKRRFYSLVVKGLGALGLTYEKVVKQLPEDVVSSLGNMFEQKEHEDGIKKLGITWNE